MRATFWEAGQARLIVYGIAGVNPRGSIKAILSIFKKYYIYKNTMNIVKFIYNGEYGRSNNMFIENVNIHEALAKVLNCHPELVEG